MRSLVSAELLKLRTTRSLYVASAALLLLTMAPPVFYATIGGGGEVEPLRPGDLPGMLTSSVPLAGGIVLLVGLLASAGEFRHRTVLTSRLAEPSAGRLLVAKLATMGFVGLVAGLLVSTLTLVEAAVVFGHEGVAFEPLAHGVPRVALVVPLVLAVYGLLGVAIGSLLRNTAAAVGATMVWAFVIEGILPMVTRNADLVTWLPRGLLNQTLNTSVEPGQVAPLAAGALLLAYGAALVAATAVVDRRREL